MTAAPISRPALPAQDLRMLEALLSSCAPGALGSDDTTAERVREALRTGEETVDIMLCLPGDTDAMAALQFARAAIDWWEHRLVVHDHLLAAVASG